MPQSIAGFSEGAGDVAGAIVCHDAGDDDAEAFVVCDRRFQKVDGAYGFFVWFDLHERHPRGVVDANMDKVPADAAALALVRAVTDDPVADTIEAPEFLDVDVEHVARFLALKAFDQIGRREIAQSAKGGAFEHASVRRRADVRDSSVSQFRFSPCLLGCNSSVITHQRLSFAPFFGPCTARNGETQVS